MEKVLRMLKGKKIFLQYLQYHKFYVIITCVIHKDLQNISSKLDKIKTIYIYIYIYIYI